MKKKLKAAISITLASLFLSFPAFKAEACGPVFPSAVIINWTHPDMPLKLFAQGNIGVVQPSWARSYMCVAYRYLNDAPLNEKEQASIIRLWHKRLGEVDFFAEGTYTDPLDKYLKVRAKVMGLTDKEYYQVYSPASSYGVEQKIVGSAYDTARKTLEERIQKFGIKSPQVKEWINGQDHVFGIGFDKEKSIPPELGADADPLIKADRAYQIAAANFYLKKYGEAAKIFEQIEKDKNSPWSKWAPYLIARCKVNSACDGNNYASFADAKSFVQGLLNSETNKDKRQDYVDFLGRLEATETSPADMLDKLTPAISKEHSESYGHDVGDVTVLMDKIYFDGNSEDDKSKTAYDFSKHDLLDWIDTFQKPFDYYYYSSVEEKKKQHEKYAASAKKAISKWRKTKSNPWLVAAVSSNSLSNPSNKDLLDAALNLPTSNPAYLTANFYAVDALIAQKKTAEAKKRIQSILAMKELPPTTRNMYKAQLMAVASSSSEYLQASCFNFPTESDNNLYLPQGWIKIEKQNNFNIASSGWDGMVADDLNRNLPLSKLIELSKDASLPIDFRKKLTACAWVKAQTLNSPESAKQVSSNFQTYFPALASLIKACDQAANATTRQFLLAKLMNKAFGATPYLQGGVPRMGSSMLEFNWYHNNYWLPIPLKVEAKKQGDEEGGWEWPQVVAPGNETIDTMMRSYYKPGVSRLLSAQEKSAAAKELQTMFANHPSRLLGDAVISYSQSNPKDPDAPELLHLIVKLPKWSGSSPIGSEYSKKAYKVLHSNYKGSKWAKKATCWY
ncbi:MAG: hypothetical protein SFY67_10615 [Candidatus Melainabacteria bacterium]|nr:hypothetical protein [Candidatus Melainabacteria bacterium]